MSTFIIYNHSCLVCLYLITLIMYERISWNDRLTKSAILNASKKEVLLRALIHLFQQQDPGQLGQCFNLQDTLSNRPHRHWDRSRALQYFLPGIIARSGKCPVKKLSLIVTFLRPTIDFSSICVTRSTIRNGYLTASCRWMESDRNSICHVSVYL